MPSEIRSITFLRATSRLLSNAAEACVQKFSDEVLVKVPDALAE
jgi:hypothetical protein